MTKSLYVPRVIFKYGRRYCLELPPERPVARVAAWIVAVAIVALSLVVFFAAGCDTGPISEPGDATAPASLTDEQVRACYAAGGSLLFPQALPFVDGGAGGYVCCYDAAVRFLYCEEPGA